MNIHQAHKLLGIPITDSLEEKKKVYRKLAHLYHPDKGGDLIRFLEIQKAWETVETFHKPKQAERGWTGYQYTDGINFHYNGNLKDLGVDMRPLTREEFEEFIRAFLGDNFF